MTRIRLLVLLMITLFAFPALAQDAPELTENFTTPNEQIRFLYPAGWHVDASDGAEYLDVSLASTPEALDKNVDDEPFLPGEVRIQMLVDETAKLGDTLNEGISPDDSPEVLLSFLVAETIRSEQEGFTFGEVTAFTIHDLPAARVPVTFGDNGEGIVMMSRYDEMLSSVIFLSTAPGELQDWESTALAVFESLIPVSGSGDGDRIAPAAELTETLTATELSLLYPEGWQTREVSDDVVYIANTPAALDHAFGDTFNSGDVQILVDVSSIEELSELIEGGINPDDSPLKILQGLIKGEAVEDSVVVIGEPESLQIGGMDAARVRLESASFEGRALIVEYAPGLFINMQVYAAPGELVAWETTAEAIIESISLVGETPVEPTPETALELTEITLTADGLTNISYPAGWFLRPSGEDAVYIANSESAVEKDYGSAFEPGEVNIFIGSSTIDRLRDQMQLELSENVTPMEFMTALREMVTEVVLSEPEVVTVGEWEAVRMAARSEFGFDVVAWAIAIAPNRMLTVQLLTAPTEAEEWESTALAIAQSVTLALD